MTQKWLDLVVLFGKKSQREKLLLIGCVLAGLFMLWTFSFSAKLTDRQDELIKRFNSANLAKEKTDVLQKLFINASQNNPNIVKQNKISELEKKLTELDKNLETLSVGLVPASELSNVLRDVLVSNTQMQLIGLIALPPEEQQLQVGEIQRLDDNLLITDTKETKGSAEILNQKEDESKKVVTKNSNFRGIGVYKYAVIVQLKGTYFDTIHYLQTLENLEWKLYWSELDYVVKNTSITGNHEAIITLEVYTLSTAKGVAND